VTAFQLGTDHKAVRRVPFLPVGLQHSAVTSHRSDNVSSCVLLVVLSRRCCWSLYSYRATLAKLREIFQTHTHTHARTRTQTRAHKYIRTQSHIRNALRCQKKKSKVYTFTWPGQEPLPISSAACT